MEDLCFSSSGELLEGEIPEIKANHKDFWENDGIWWHWVNGTPHYIGSEDLENQVPASVMMAFMLMGGT